MKAKYLLTIACCSLFSAPALPAQSIERRTDSAIPAKLDSMYLKGLRFLSTTQQPDGSWKDSAGAYPGVVGLAILAFLAHGEDPNVGPYADNLQKAVDFLLKQQNETNGYIGTSLYNHGFATLALAEAYGSLQDDRLEAALTQAVELILSAQKKNSKDGWRYRPDDTDADTTVSGCQIVALLAARNAGIAVPDEAIEKALKYMSSCRNKSDGSYGYTSKFGGKVTLTAIGSLCFSLAKQKDSKGYLKSLEYLKENLDYRESHYPFYFEYYMSQALFQADEEVWKVWNEKNISLLSVTQQQNGSWAGNRGPTYCTASALLSVALNYRFLPIYEK